MPKNPKGDTKKTTNRHNVSIIAKTDNFVDIPVKHNFTVCLKKGLHIKQWQTLVKTYVYDKLRLIALVSK